MGKINKFLVLKVIYTAMVSFCVIHAFFFASDLTIFGFDIMMACLSAAAILVVEYAEKTSEED
jgi:hypothetical protein